MPQEIFETKEELDKAIQSKEKLSQSKEKKLSDTITLIDRKRNEIDELYKKKGEQIALVKKLIKEGKELQKKRDALQTKLKPMWNDFKKYQKNMDKHAENIKELKGERNEFNKEARGTLGYLENSLIEQFKTLLTREISLKEEIRIYSMFIDLRKRTQISAIADEKHQKITENYHQLKENEKKKNTILQEINEIKKTSQDAHFESIAKFKEKNNVSKNIDDIKKKIEDLKREVNDLNLTTQAVKMAKDRIRKDHSYLKRKKSRFKGDRIRLSKREKIAVAKKKLDNSEKMGLEDLKILLNTGKLNLGEENKKGKKKK